MNGYKSYPQERKGKMKSYPQARRETKKLSTGERREKMDAKYRSMKNNAAGHFFEDGIRAACRWYSEKGVAEVVKVPEPFRVLKKDASGIFKGRFTERAEPDFQGTLSDGRAIVFEAKYTSTDTMRQGVVTEKQAEALERHYQLGALVGVCVGIREDFFFVPWTVWRDMKTVFGRKSVRAGDLERMKIPFRHGIEFLEGVER